MKPAVRELLLGLLFSTLSAGIVFGAGSLAFVETQSSPTAPAAERYAQTEITPPAEEVITHFEEAEKPTSAPVPFEEAVSPSPTRCAVPENWVTYEIRNGDSLELLAAAINVPAQIIKEANCLISDSLIPGSTILLPVAIPAITSTVAATEITPACPTPPNWTEHIMQPDENLLILSQKYHVRIADLIAANCYQNATILRAGDIIFLPYPEIATSTPAPGSTAVTPGNQASPAAITVESNPTVGVATAITH